MIFNKIRSLVSNIKYYSITYCIFLTKTYSMENKINIEKNEKFYDFNYKNIINRNNSQKNIKAKYDIPQINKIKNFEKFNGRIKQYSNDLIYKKNKNFNDFCKSESLYMLIKKLDHIVGASGLFYYKVIDRSKKEYFCKVTNMHKIEYLYINEINNQYKLSNYDNIAKLIDAYIEQNNKKDIKKYYVFTEYYNKGELFDFIKKRKINNKNIYKIMKQVIDSIYICHKNGISHRDIKLENFVLDKDYNVKLIDFEFSTTLENDDTNCGTISYSSPELGFGENYDCKKNDIYSLGIVLYILNYTRYPNFFIKEKMYNKNSKVNDNVLKTHLNTLLKQIFVDEKSRITIDDIIESDFYKYINSLL